MGLLEPVLSWKASYKKVVKMLVQQLKEFKQGKASSVYLPFAYSHKAVAHVLTPLVAPTAEELYANLTSLLNELASLDAFKRLPTYERPFLLLYALGAIGEDCAREFLTFNRHSLFHVARIVLAYGAAAGSVGALQALAGERCSALVSKVADEVVKELVVISRAVARVYDEVLLVFGSAYSPMKGVVAATPFTRTFMYVLNKAVAPEAYIGALKKFVECVVAAHPTVIEATIEACREELHKHRAIGVEEKNTEHVVFILYRLTELLSSVS
jgi:hypothetical protein